MWWILLLIIAALVIIKVLKVSLFWTAYNIPHESYPSYLYRMIWRYNTGIVVDIIRDEVKHYGPVYGSYRGFTPCLVVADIGVAKEVLIKKFSHFFDRTLFFQTGNPIWDNALPNLPYDGWKLLRSVMGHTFTASKMRGIVPKFDKISKRLVDKMAVLARSSDNTIVLHNQLKAYAIDSMTAVSFGIEANSLENPENEFMTYMSELVKPGLTMLTFFVAPNLMKYMPFVDFPPKKTQEFFGRVGKHALAEKRKKLDDVIANDTADILDLHLIAQREDPEHLTDEILTSQAFIFLFAGIDGITMALDLALYHLAVHPDIQQKTFDELMGVMKGRTELQYEDVLRLKYLEACVLESLRLAPLITVVDRVCTSETEVNGIKITKGMVIDFAIPSINMNPTYFAEPERFQPERFLKAGGLAEEQDITAYLIFGTGPKQCVGRRLALMNTQTLLANILLKMRLERVPDTPYPIEVKTGLNFTLFAKSPLKIGIVSRNA